MQLDYISILAGGVCPMNCKFCVGKSIRKKEEPHFASFEAIKVFLEIYKTKTKLLSISGSTSDPLLVKNLPQVVKLAKGKFRLALHTCAVSELPKINPKDFDRIVISLHNFPSEKLKKFIKENKNKVRISSVYTKKNKTIFDSLSFFDKIPCNTFTVRKNVFDPMIPKFTKKLKQKGEIFNQPIYEYKKKKIALWDFAEANKSINARYLWPDGKIKPQCYWHSLHKKLP